MSRKKLSVLTFDFSTLYTAILRNLQLKMLLEGTNFVFKSKVRKCIGFCKTSIHWISMRAGRKYFTKQTLVNAMFFLINKCFFAIGDMALKQDIGIGIDPEIFWVTLFLYFLNLSRSNNLFQMDLLKHINIMGFLDSLMTFDGVIFRC